MPGEGNDQFKVNRKYVAESPLKIGFVSTSPCSRRLKISN